MPNMWGISSWVQGVWSFVNATPEKVKPFLIQVLLWRGHMFGWTVLEPHRNGQNAGSGKPCHRLVSSALKYAPYSISFNSFFPHLLPMWSPTYSPDSFSPQVLILLEGHLPLQLGCFCLSFVSVGHPNTLDCFINSFYWRLLGPSLSVKIREG